MSWDEAVKKARESRFAELQINELYWELKRIAGAWPDKQQAAACSLDLTVAHKNYRDRALFEPAYRYFERLTNELILNLQCCLMVDEVDPVLNRKRTLLQVLPEVAPDLAITLDLHIRAARGDKAARATLDAKPPF